MVYVYFYENIFQDMGCLVSLFSQKNLGFGPSFCKMQLNTMQIFFGKKVVILHFGF